MSKSRLVLDVNNASAASIGANGLTDPQFGALREQYAPIIARIAKDAAAGKLGYTKLPADNYARDSAVKLANDLGNEFDTLVAMGIGGSSLGAHAVFSALTHPHHNFLPADRRHGMRVFFPDNSDPVSFKLLLDALDWKKTVFAAVTKSGGTAETLSQLAIVREELQKRLGAEAVRRQIIAITDPEKGPLRGLVKSEGWRSLPVPPDVGGRFSVLTACGTLSSACAGIDVAALLDGAQAALTRCLPASKEEYGSPAGMLGALLHAMDAERGRPIHVLMPYADALRELGAWYAQLWAESLGKLRGDVPTGPTPMHAVGSTDQHSLLQLLMQGPQNKVVVFVALEEWPLDISIPPAFPQVPEAAYLGGVTLSKLLTTEQRATATALAVNGRPSVTIRMPRLDAFHLGELLMTFEIATSVAGELYGINTYDQPGVELGKQYASGILGRPGYEWAAKEVASRPEPQPSLILG